MKKLMNFRPLLFIAVGLTLSIFSSSLFLTERAFWGAFVLVLLFAVSILFCFTVKDKSILKRNLIFIIVFIVFCSVGFISFRLTTLKYENATLNDSYYTVSGRVEEVVSTDDGMRLIIKKASVAGVKNGSLKYKINVYVVGETTADIGDEICFYGLISDYSAYYEDRISSTNIVNGVKYSSYVKAEDIVINGNKANVFEKVNVFMRNTLRTGLDEEEFGVAYAMLCGNSDYISVDLLSDYRNAGVAHIFAVSGLHIGFLCAVLTFILRKVRINDYLKSILIVAVLLFYSGVCGFSASSLRATVMCGMLLLATAGGKRYDMLSSIGLAGILILLITPHELLCAGFMLSFGVVLGIIVLSPPLKRLLKFLPDKISSALSVVISAQLFSMPISLSVFGQTSLIAVLANLIFVPFVSVIFVLCFACTLLGGIFNLQKFFLFGPSYILKGVSYVISAVDYEIFIIGGFSLGAFVIAYYLTAFIISDLTNLKVSFKAIVSALLVGVFVIGTMIYNIDQSKKTTAYVIGGDGISATAILSKEEDVLIISSVKKAFSLSRLKSFSNKNSVTKFDKIFIGNMQTNLDVQEICTRINAVFKFDTVYYCGEEMDLILEKSFTYSNFIYCGNNGEKCEDENYKFASKGYAVTFAVGDKSAVIYSEFGNDNPCLIDESVPNPSLVVLYDYEERINDSYNFATKVSYLHSKKLVDAKTHGNFKYNFN